MHIRCAKIEDIPVLLPLVEAYWHFEKIQGFEPKSLSEQLQRLISTPTLGTGWLVEIDQTAVGYLLVVYVFSLEHRGITAEIDEFFIAQDYRAGGIGEELLRLVEEKCIFDGCTNISLQLSRKNQSARAFYHRMGYSERSDFELLDKTLIIQPQK